MPTIKLSEMNVELNTKITHKIDREYNNLLLKDAIVTTNEDGKTEIKPNLNNVVLATEYLIKQQFGLSQEQIDDISKEDYTILEKEITNLVAPEAKKGEKQS